MECGQSQVGGLRLGRGVDNCPGRSRRRGRGVAPGGGFRRGGARGGGFRNPAPCVLRRAGFQACARGLRGGVGQGVLGRGQRRGRHTHVEFQKGRDIPPAGGAGGEGASGRRRRNPANPPQRNGRGTRRGAAGRGGHIQLPQAGRQTHSPQSRSRMDKAARRKTSR